MCLRECMIWPCACRRTNGGNAYPLSMPWGSLGTAMNGMCMAGVYQALNYDSVESPLRKSAACFVQRQLGYTLNHKCPATNAETFNSTCNTPEPLNGEGFSYMVGCVPLILGPQNVSSSGPAYSSVVVL